MRIKQKIEICLEGTKGAGKTTVIRQLSEHFSNAGWQVQIDAPFQHGNSYARRLGHKDGLSMAGTSVDANREIVQEIRRYIERRNADFKDSFETSDREFGLHIFDRHWISFYFFLFDRALHKAANENGGIRDELDRSWKDIRRSALPTCSITCSPEVSLARREGVLARDVRTLKFLDEDRRLRLNLAQEFNSRCLWNFDTTDGRFEDLFPAIVDGIVRKVEPVSGAASPDLP